MYETNSDLEIPISVHALTRMLDIVDYGMLVVSGESRVIYTNRVAREELDAEHPLHLAEHELRVRNFRDVEKWRQAISRAHSRGMQALLTLGDASGMGLNISVVPLSESDDQPTTLIIFGRRHVCHELSSDAFARQHGLTAAETRVLKLLSAGHRPNEIRQVLGVRLTTVRTHISSIRAKTHTRDIGEIMHRVARLPPLPHLLRRAA